MARPQVNHVKSALDQMFDGEIKIYDHDKLSDEDKKKIYYSRALAAYALVNIASINVQDAVDSITDGFQDNGIDAIYYDDKSCVLYIVQSKFIESGIGEPDSGDLRKFKDGIIDLIEERFDRFNKKVNAKKDEIQEAFSESKITLNIVLAYTGKGFADCNQSIIADLLRNLNDSTEWVFFTDYNLKALHTAVTISLTERNIDVELMLSNWGTVEDPYIAYYGQVSAYDIAMLWKEYRKGLFLDNLRNFVGYSNINTQIIKTIENEPQNFVYYNNGITLLANKVAPLPAKTVGKTTGLFACTGISIINGAQTVGCLGSVVDKFPDKVAQCKVFIRLIPLESTPDNFGTNITVAANTQNRIEKRDFVSLDQTQANLKTELALAGLHYHYRRTDEGIIQDDKNLNLEEATIALACLLPDVGYAVYAKREIGVFWEDIEKEPYTLIFNDGLKPTTLWKAVLIYRRTMEYLAKQKTTKHGREASFYVFGNYIVLNIVYELILREHIYNPSYSFEDIEKDRLTEKIEDTVAAVYIASDDLFPTALMHQLYRNINSCKQIKDSVVFRLKTKYKVNIK